MSKKKWILPGSIQAEEEGEPLILDKEPLVQVSALLSLLLSIC
jgi:hypothetical protein